MTTTHSTTTRFQPLALAGLLLVVTASLIVGAHATALMMAASSERPEVSIAQTSADDLGGLVPGDRVALDYVISSPTAVVYALEVDLEGSGGLPAALEAVIRAAGGDVLYSGPLGEAEFRGRVLPAGQPEELTIDVELPRDATLSAAGSVALVVSITAGQA